MKQLNNDCLIYICQYLSFRDKINFIKTCKQIYNIAQDIFKECVVNYDTKNIAWITKYKPIVYLTYSEIQTENIIQCVPKQILNSNMLYYLNISYNQLNYLPNNINMLTNLQYLNISDCNLSYLPESIKYLKKIVHLDCSYNNITTLPKLPYSLSYLYANNNNIIQVQNLPFYAKLDYNNIVSINVTLECKHLTITHNLLENIDGGLNLLYLDASQNKLQKFYTPPKSKTIKVRNNFIYDIILSNTLEKMYIDNNLLTILPVSSSCKIIKSSNNLLKKISGDTNNLEYLDVGNNNINVLSNLPRCIELYCHDNNISILEPQLYPNITNLSINNNPIQCIGKFKKLESIYIESSQMMTKI